VNAPLALRASIAVLLCAAFILLAAFSDEILRPGYQAHHAETIRSPTGEIVGVSIYDIQPVRSTIEVVLAIAIPFLSLAGVAGYVASRTQRRKVLAGGGAAVCGAWIALMVIHVVMWRTLGQSYLPGILNVVGWSVVAFAIGAPAAWATAVWWPNKSLERTREK